MKIAKIDKFLKKSANNKFDSNFRQTPEQEIYGSDPESLKNDWIS